jgi:hypothetical protein
MYYIPFIARCTVYSICIASRTLSMYRNQCKLFMVVHFCTVNLSHSCILFIASTDNRIVHLQIHVSHTATFHNLNDYEQRLPFHLEKEYKKLYPTEKKTVSDRAQR